MKKIKITRGAGGKVKFQTVSIDNTENVFFSNQDEKAAHWPATSPTPQPFTPTEPFTSNRLGKAPSPNSSQCVVPPPPNGTTQVVYGCRIKGHEQERGIINVFPPLAAVNVKLTPATKGQPVNQQVVSGGMSPYTISDPLFQITDDGGNVGPPGDGIGPGLQLKATTDNTGVWVTGAPTASGTYNFTFTVDDAMGRNLQQVQYSLKVA